MPRPSASAKPKPRSKYVSKAIAGRYVRKTATTRAPLYRLPGTVLGKDLRVALKYVTMANLFTHSTAAQFSTGLDLRLNDCFLPRAGTHQPYGWDQLTALYFMYKVEKVHVKLTITPVVATQALICAWRLYPDQNSSALVGVGLDVAMEQPNTFYKTLSDGDGRPLVVDIDVDLANLVGLTKMQWNAEVTNYASLTSASPTLVPRLYVAIGDLSTTAQTNFALVSAELDFYTHFWQVKTVAQS